MRIELSETDDDRLWPQCVRSLRLAQDLASFHNDWGLRAPLGAYNVSLSALPKLLATGLQRLESLGPAPMSERSGESPADQLLEAHKSLLYAMFEHVEACRALARGYFPRPSADKEPRVREFNKTVKPFRDPVSRSVNAMKHSQARLGFVQGGTNFMTVPGYCVQAAVEPGVIGPDPAVHRPEPNTLAAISFGYDLRWHFLTIYALGRHLANFVKALRGQPRLGQGVETRPEEPQASEPVCPWAFDIASRLSKLPSFVYPHECRPPMPTVRAGLRLDERGEGGHVRIPSQVARDSEVKSPSIPR